MLSDNSIIRPGEPSLKERIKTNICKRVTKKQRKELNLIYSKSIIKKDFSIVASFCGGELCIMTLA